jgi:glycosyltransferase involved in cell wall biosynthesis
MIIYISDTLGSKRNGGVSLSGVDFLQLLRLHYNNVQVLASDTVPDTALAAKALAGQPLYPIKGAWRLASIYKMRPSLRSFARFVLVNLKNIGAKHKICLPELYEDNRKNILFVNSWSSLYPSVKFLDDPRFRKVCIVRGNPESFFWQSKGTDKALEIEKAAEYLRQFDDLIFVSRIGKDRWQPYLSETIRSYYLPNSIEEKTAAKLLSQEPKSIARSLNFPEDKINLVAVGSVQTRKGQDILIDTALKLRKMGYKNFCIHIVGVVSEPWGGNEIVNQIKSSTVSSHFMFYGHRNNVLHFVRAADICLFPSRAEAFPRTIAEYMALEKPIVSTDVSGVPEMITDGENGLLCGIGEGEKMGERIARLFENPELTIRLAKSARETYETYFSKAAQAQNACDLFTKLDHGVGN